VKVNPTRYKPRAGQRVHLADWPTAGEDCCASDEAYEAVLREHVEALSARQAVLAASARYSILLILQGMDAAGKDGTINHLLSGVDPQGCEVFQFKAPSAEELKHDFLWRTTCRLPERGRIGIFNRSYYEEVLIVRVHRAVLEQQNLPEDPRSDTQFWRDRYRSITELERHLYKNGTRIIKIFLHLSKREQKKRFIARIDDPTKNWKFSSADVHERGYWRQYAQAYGEALSATNTRESPWYIVPADRKEVSRLIVSQILMNTIDRLVMTYPQPTPGRRRELLSIARRLNSE
jgi:PPK2 family polyphosphate:nucleotide phosphotransferase